MARIYVGVCVLLYRVVASGLSRGGGLVLAQLKGGLFLGLRGVIVMYANRSLIHHSGSQSGLAFLYQGIFPLIRVAVVWF